jgi:hypothetical protein
MEDRTTPHLGIEEHAARMAPAILTGNEFLTGREAQLQRRLAELEEELMHLEDVTDDVQALEGQAADALCALFDVLEPAARTTTVARPQPGSEPAPAPEPQPTALAPGSARRKLWRALEVGAALLILALSAFVFMRLYGPDLWHAAPQATRVALPVPTVTASALPTATGALRETITPTPSPSAAPPLPTAFPAPVVTRRGSWTDRTTGAGTLRLSDASDAGQLELPLSMMAETIQTVAGSPVLKPLLPAEGAGLYRGSVPFGEAGLVAILVPERAAPPDLWQVRPGERLAGCNTDGTCYDYRVTLAETWSLDQVRQFLAEWPADGGVLVYVESGETGAWVIQAQLRGEER